MKFISFSLTRKQLLNIMAAIMVIIIIVAAVVSGTSDDRPAAATQRVLPVYCVDTDKKNVAITFDAAWSADDTDELIQILDKYDAKAAFFCVGDWLDKNSESVRKLYEAGHIIANHSDSHKHLSSLNENDFLEDVKKCNEKIKSITGKQTRYYRGPYGEYSNMCINAIRRIGMEYVQWNCDSVDWKENISVDEIVNNAMRNVSPGSIFLFHNGLENTPQALSIVLDKLSAQGYRFVSLDELIMRENYYIDNTGRQFSMPENSM